MRKIVAALFISVDGVVESPNEWMSDFFSEDLGRELAAQMERRDTLLIGRRTYQDFAAVWPRAGEDNPVAVHMNTTPKVVVSTSLDTVDEWPNSTLVRDDVPGRLSALKAQPGKDIAVIGSATLVRWLLAERLVDELVLLVHPVIVGTGRQLFDGERARTALRLADVTSFDGGVVKLVYTPA